MSINIMFFNDKFNIIARPIQEDIQPTFNMIENDIENYLNSDIRIRIPDFLNQIIYFNTIEPNKSLDKNMLDENMSLLISKIDIQIKNYLFHRRNNIRLFIKKNNFNIISLNKFIKTLILKLEYLNNIIPSFNNIIIVNGINALISIILSDVYIILYFEGILSIFNIDIQNEIKILITLVRNLKKYDNYNTYNNLIKIFVNIFTKHILNIEETPLPENLKTIHKLNESIKYYKKVNYNYNYIIYDLNKFDSPIIHIIIKYLIKIIETNSLYEIEYVFNSLWKDLNKLIFIQNFEQKEIYYTTLSTKIICLCNNTLMNNNYENTLHLINILKYIHIIFKDGTLQDVLKSKISVLLSSDEIINNILINIDNMIKQNKQDEVMKTINFIINIKNKDLFINKYYQNLVNRLLDNFSIFNLNNVNKFKEFINLEKKILNILKTHFGDVITYRLTKVIYDIEKSLEDSLNYRLYNDIDLKNPELFLTTSYNIWDINQTEGLITEDIILQMQDTFLGRYIDRYQQYYKKYYLNKRILNWYPHFGEVNITYENQKLKMLPIHFMVLELFNDTNINTMDYVINSKFFSNYTIKFKNDIINSFVMSGLFKIRNMNIYLLTDKQYKNDIIKIFFTISDYNIIWEQKREEEFIHSREEIIYSNINHILKITKIISKNELFKCVKDIITLFELESDIFDKSLSHMCKMDYIKETDGMYEKLYY